MHRKFLCIFLVGISFCFSCSKILYRIYGVESLREFDTSLYENVKNAMVNQYKGPSFSLVSSDSLFKEYMYYFDGFYNNETYQPIQMLYFNRDSLVSFHANCYAKASVSGSLNWNYDGRFDYFIPKSAVNPIQTKGNLQGLLNIYGIASSNTENTLVFFWTNMLNKQSQLAFTTIVENIEKHAIDSILPNIILINTDHFFIKNMH